MNLAPEDDNRVVGEIFNIFSLAGNFRCLPPPGVPQLRAGLPLHVGIREKAKGQLGGCRACEWGRKDSRVVGPWPDPQEKGATGRGR